MRALFLSTAFLAATMGAAAAADTFAFDPGHTQVQFAIDRFGFTQVFGVFPDLKGNVTLDQQNPEKSVVDVTVQIASVDSNNPARDKIVAGKAWLDAADFPTMHFASTKVVRTGDHTANVTGDLTLHGQTHPLTLSVTLNKLGKYVVTNSTAAGFSATGTLKRSDYGITTATGLIGDDVTIRIEALGVPSP